ncbi:TPR repeat-containing protein [Thiothrix caldifontis]|uniref:TPR repeat-containing protein n=1 Tax=Thiothrix caldifontis TaxID=525918 RepID=A0A1H4D2I7_9GAMM|nr:tetratricopeptide repeat protein [Thiothrix caldifontis]SEA66857.1 TPR repeat-containing protein [Thiothrix caldifontis]
MTLNPRYSLAFAALLTMLLSACSPNPTVLQDRVYGSRSVVIPPKVVKQAPVNVPAPSKPKPSASPVITQSAPVSKPVISHPPTPVVKPEDTSAAAPEVVEVLTPKVYPSSPAVKALMKAADSEVAKGNLDKAADTLERALRIEADNPDLWMKLATINERQGNHDQAVNMLSKAKAYQEQLN